MKYNIGEITESYVSDNKQNIEGNIAEYLWREVNEGNEAEFFWYLTDETIEALNGNVELWHEKGEELKEWLYENYDFDISKL